MNGERGAPSEETSEEGRSARSPGGLRGCLGILAVLLMPVLLALPVEALGVPRPVATFIPLAAFACAALGLWLMWGVPAGKRVVPNPFRPITRSGHAPVREEPATGANRIALIFIAALLIVSASGVVVAGAATARSSIVFAGIAVTGAAGLALSSYGLLVTTGRLPAPAWRWLRLPLGTGRASRGLPFVIVGWVPLLWALLFAAGNGAWWGSAGLLALVLVSAAVTPLAQRWPRSRL